MKVLFAHGMRSRPKEWVLDVMREAGFDAYALHLNYNQHPDSFQILRDYCKEKQIEAVIGHSHGGYHSYWLGEELGIPCLLLNPHLSVRLKKQMTPPISQRVCPLCLVALSTDDKLVDPLRTLKFLGEDNPENKKPIKIKWLEGAGHSLDIQYFSEVTNWLATETNQLMMK